MLRILFGAGLLAASSLSSAETWNFTYTGFHDTVANAFDAGRQLTGSFVGSDADGDGTIGRAEITSLVLQGQDFVACEAQSNEYWHCGAEAFSYSPGGALAFSAGQYGSDPEGWVGGGHYFISGDGEYGYSFRPSQWEEWGWQWTGRTAFAISPAPEPATWTMLAAGLVLLLSAARLPGPRRAVPQ